MIGSKLAQRYEITGELGRGGMGRVYLAHDPHLQREVAVKVLDLANLGSDAEGRFLREAQLVAKMDHPSIVPIYDLGRHEESLFFVMPVVHGETLHALIRQGNLALGEILEIVAQVAEALDYSHQQGVIHRDIKPENIMVSRGEGLRARVMDFGLALGDSVSRLTRTGSLPGTLAYLSPEQILAVDLDGRTDIYSLGTILHECLAGKPPFAGSRYSLLYQIVNEPPPPLQTFGVDEKLASIVARCLDKEPEERPARGNDLAAMLYELAEELSQSVRDRDVVHVGDGERGEGSRPSPLPLVGRRREVEALVGRLEAALERECQLVMIGGEAGLGKTRLVEEVEQIGRGRGFRVLRGRFSDQEGAFPFQGFGELIRDYFRGQDRALSSGAPDLSDLGADLKALFPMLSELPPLRDVAGRAESQGLGLEAARRGDPTHLFEVLARTLRRLMEGKPAVFVLEHLQGAEISIEALQYLVRRLGPTPSVFVGTYRPSEVERRHPLMTLLKSFQDEPRFLPLVLKPLGEGDSREMLRSLVGGGEVSQELARKLYEATEGNPYFTRELVHSLMDKGGMSRDESGVWVLSPEATLAPDSLPETIQQVVEARLEVLPEEASHVLQVASILGRSFDYEELEELIGSEIEEGVERLLHEGLLAEDRRARRDRLHFSSGVVRDVLHSGLSRRRRRALHRRHASLLEGRFAGRLEQVYPQLVHHFAAGDEPEKTVQYALLLARVSTDAVGSEAAVRALRTALEFAVDEDTEVASEGELRLLLAEALRSGGSHEPAMKEAGRAVRSLERGHDLAGAARAALVAAEAAWQGRRVGETRRWVEKGIDLARLAGSRDVLHRLLILGSTVANLRGEHQKARARWEEAQELVAEPQQALPRGGVLKTTLPLEVASLDIRDAVTLEDQEVLGNVFETLVRSGADGHLTPLLCDGWERSADSLTYRFRLRGEARFSDGSPLGALDVKRSMEATFRRAGSPACCAIEGCEGFQRGDAQELQGIEVLGEHDLCFHLREPLPIFPVLLTDLKTAVFRLDEDGKPIGTGPFKVSERRSQEIHLSRNETYWRGTTPFVDGVEFRLGMRGEAAAEALLAGGLDLGSDFAPDTLAALLRDERFRSGLVEATRQSVYLAAFHQGGPAASRPEVRRALCEVIRPEEMVLRTLGRLAQPASCLIPPMLPGHDPKLVRPQRSPAEARALLEEAGLRPPLKLRAVVQPLFRERFLPFLDSLLAQWAAAGLEVSFEEPTLGTYLDGARNGSGIDLWLGRWGADYDDPDSFAYALLDSRAGFLGELLGSPAIDELVARARREARASRRQALYRKLEGLLAERNVLLPLFYDVDYRLVGPRLLGVELRNAPPFVGYAEIAKLPESFAEAAPVERDGGTIHVPLATTFTTLSPVLAHLTAASEAVANVFETLTRVDEGARIVPHLATEFRLEEGGRRFRFKLRNNVRFHDGRKLSVRDVRFTFEELVRHGEEVTEAKFLPIRGARAFRDGDASELRGFVVLSANEFAIELECAVSFFPAMLTSPTMAIVPEGLRRFSGDWSDGCCGTGPFRVAHFLAGERLELEASPYSWRRSLPRCDRLVFELAKRPEEVYSDLRSGQRIVASGLVPALVSELRRDGDLQPGYLEAPGLSTWFLAVVPGGVLDDPDLLRLLAPFLDAETVVSSTLGRLAQPARSLLPPGLLGYEPRDRGPAAVDEGSRPLHGVELRVALVPPYLGELAPLWNGLRHNLESAGAKVRAVAAPASEIKESMARGEVDLLGGRWVACYPDPDSLSHYFHSWGVLAPLVSSPKLDELFERGRLETDAALRHAIYLQIDQSLTGDGRVLPLFHDQVYRLLHRQIAGGRLRFGWPELAYEELSVKS